MPEPYIFRRLDTEAVIELPFSYVLEQDRIGVVTLPDGVQARRCVHLEEERDRQNGSAPQASKAVHCGLNSHDLTLSLGFSQVQLQTFEADRIKHGFTGVEFYPDPQVKGMIGIKCSSEAEKDRYIRHRGLVNKSGRNGGMGGISKEALESARKLVLERHPIKQAKGE